jgi:hypothetical protein
VGEIFWVSARVRHLAGVLAQVENLFQVCAESRQDAQSQLDGQAKGDSKQVHDHIVQQGGDPKRHPLPN